MYLPRAVDTSLTTSIMTSIKRKSSSNSWKCAFSLTDAYLLDVGFETTSGYTNRLSSNDPVCLPVTLAFLQIIGRPSFRSIPFSSLPSKPDVLITDSTSRSPHFLFYSQARWQQALPLECGFDPFGSASFILVILADKSVSTGPLQHSNPSPSNQHTVLPNSPGLYSIAMQHEDEPWIISNTCTVV
jgi:hypothetical protein